MKDHGKIIFSVFILAFLLTLPVLAGAGDSPAMKTLSREDEARMFVKLGDEHTSRDETGEAAQYYLRALSIYDGFSAEQRIQMATYVSWNDMPAEAVEILNGVIADEPGNIKARNERAKLLGWDGRYEDSLIESEKVLELEPANKDAILAKAYALKGLGYQKEAIFLYGRILKDGENFDARLNTAYAYYELGERRKALEHINMLKPKFKHEEENMARIRQLVESELKPHEKIDTSAYDEQTKLNYEEASRLKNIADKQIENDEIKDAADNYLKAMALYDDFSHEDRLQMAIYLSWDNRMEDAIAVLDKIIEQDPTNLEARVERAKFLSWIDRLEESLVECDAVLSEEPDNRDARLVKANAISWMGKPEEAIPIYEKLLEEEEDFDVRLNLAYAYMAVDNRTKALNTIDELEPKFDYQRERSDRAIRRVNKRLRRNFQLGYKYYRDNDHTYYHKYYLNFTFYPGKWKIQPTYEHILPSTKDPDTGITTSAQAYSLALKIFRKLNKTTSLFGSVGLTRLVDGVDSNHFIGTLGVDYYSKGLSLGANLERSAMVETPELIDNEIITTAINVNAGKELSSRWSINGSATYTDYSDDNSSISLSAGPTYRIIRENPIVDLSYTIRYLDYDRHSSGGYFDPKSFISHQVSADIFYSKGSFYTDWTLYVGLQSFDRNAVHTSDTYAGWIGMLGYNLSNRSAIELNSEGGNYAVGSAAGGFTYYMYGIHFYHAF